MVGHYKRSKWQAKGKCWTLQSRAFRDRRHAHHSRRSLGLEANAHRKNHFGFSEWQKCRATSKPGSTLSVSKSAPRVTCSFSDKGKIGERYLLGAEILLSSRFSIRWQNITGLPAPKLKIPHGLALGVAYANTAFSRFARPRARDSVEGVKIAQHMMFVDAKRAQKELGFKPGLVAAAFERAVRWYVDNGYVLPAVPRKSQQRVPPDMRILVTFAVEAEFALGENCVNFVRSESRRNAILVRRRFGKPLLAVFQSAYI